ncbi:hypothetical protein [Rubritalea squalenifaciens]|nr:hypothetical protein [Rubritalea squalenifaciens]
MKLITLPLLLTLLPLWAEEPKAEAKRDPQDPSNFPLTSQMWQQFLFQQPLPFYL